MIKNCSCPLQKSYLVEARPHGIPCRPCVMVLYCKILSSLGRSFLLPLVIHVYTLSEKKYKCLEAAFLLGTSACQGTWGHTVLISTIEVVQTRPDGQTDATKRIIPLASCSIKMDGLNVCSFWGLVYMYICSFPPCACRLSDTDFVDLV